MVRAVRFAPAAGRIWIQCPDTCMPRRSILPAAHGALFNGGKNTFPHRLCYDNVTDAGVVVERFQVFGQQLSFKIRGTKAQPLHSVCNQDLYRISINTCESLSVAGPF